ncbi:hypothetical protein HanPSC8_Chr00c129g0805011 [Helianthus annuus]|nr:hypothetical protein HanPSC8_Chr00c129g0805011 [Helianthus annuus]
MQGICETAGGPIWIKSTVSLLQLCSSGTSHTRTKTQISGHRRGLG